MKKAVKVSIKYNSIELLPIYNVNDYKKIANQHINKYVVLPVSKKYPEKIYFVSTITIMPRNIQQRIAGSNLKSWENMVLIYNFFATELGYDEIITKQIQQDIKTKKDVMSDNLDLTGSFFRDDIWSCLKEIKTERKI